MNIQIRVVINVPLEDRDRFPVAIEKIVDAVVEQFPGLKVVHPHSPVIVTIKELNEASVPIEEKP